jgi:hypothetical protein
MPTEQECCYMAAVLDMEGYVGILKHVRKDRRLKDNYQPVIIISQTKHSWHESMQSLWGGTIRENYTHTRNHPKWARTWNLIFSSDEMASVLKTVRPYLKLKGDQADLCLQLHERITQARTKKKHTRWTALTPEERKIRQDLYKRCKFLNQKGPRHDQLKLEMTPLDIAQPSFNFEAGT